MLLNQLINTDEDFDSGGVIEPVTLAQVKSYLRLGGFVSDTSGEQEFDYDDDLIESLITEAREWVEKYTGQYIVPRTLTVVLLNQAGGFELPGPVLGTVAYTDIDDTEITPVVVGSKFPQIETKYGCRITATYEAGYTTYPKWAENAVLAYIADHYEHRGDEAPPAPNERAAQICRPYRRVNAWQ